MRTWRTRLLAIAATTFVLTAACADPESPVLAAVEAAPTAVSTPMPVATGTPTPTVPPTAAPTILATPSPSPTPTPIPTPTPRVVLTQEWQPFALIGEMMLTLPASSYERIGFHQSGHDGAQQMRLLTNATPAKTLASRDRGTGSRTATDVVVDPEGEIRSPVTGTVLSAGTYVLYCDHSDDFVFIEPDVRPGWQVKMFHIDGVQVVPGERVEAGVTVLAPRATKLPFESQVDEFTAAPSWPHVHIEVVDPSIPDRPSETAC